MNDVKMRLPVCLISLLGFYDFIYFNRLCFSYLLKENDFPCFYGKLLDYLFNLLIFYLYGRIIILVFTENLLIQQNTLSLTRM